MQGSNSKEILLWLMRFRQRCRVTGASMRPLLTDGDEVLVDLRAYRRQQPRIGDIVIAQHPNLAGLLIIKRVKGVHEGLYYLQGDNSNPAQNSPCVVPTQLIQGRVTSLFTTAT